MSFVYVYNLSPRTTARDLADLFGRFGSVLDVQLNNDSATINFEDQEDATDAIDTLNGWELDGQRLVVTETAPSSSPRASESTLSTEQNMLQQSYETLLKQLYGLPVQSPEFLIVNGLKVNFVLFEQIANMLSQNQIERFILDPLLQPWAGPPGTPNRILTMFGRNGMSYLVKARYDPVTNQMFAPI